MQLVKCGPGQEPARPPGPAPTPPCPVVARLAEIPGISPGLACSIIAEIGLDVSRFPAAAHLVSWAGLCPRAASPDPALAPPRRTTATAGYAATSARPPPAPRSAPPPSSANTTGGSPAVAEGQSPGRRRPLHPDHHLLLSDPPPGTPTSASATTRHALTPTGRSATTSASSKPSASRSPLPKPPDPYRSDQAQRRTRPGSARPAEMSYFRVSSLRIRSIPSVPEPPGMRICEQKFYNTIKKNSVRM